MIAPDLLTSEEIQRLARELRAIETVDQTIDKLRQAMNEDTAGRAKELGEDVRRRLGPNWMRLFSDARLGVVVQAAVIQALIYERMQLVARVDGFAILPPWPAPAPTLAEIWEQFDGGR